ncbi:MAG TPA: superoxide dismutase [Pirellulales bacterium]|jgi:Fe-Mn family superoxide dismutase
MAYTLPPLPYANDALEPYIDAKTMEIHHDKHHGAYVTNVNAALEGTDLGNMPIEQLIMSLDKVPESSRMKVRNNGGGHFNHSMFWTLMGKGKGGQPKGELSEAIQKDLMGWDHFVKGFSDAAMNRFGSGWAWLVVDKSGKLGIENTPNQDNPLMGGSIGSGNKPILGLDVWEHAYYLKYQNKRKDYVDAFWNVVDWDEVAKRYAAAKKS